MFLGDKPVKTSTTLVSQRTEHIPLYIVSRQSKQKKLSNSLVRPIRPLSVICLESRFSDVSDVIPDILLSPLSVTEVKDRLRLSSLFKPMSIHYKLAVKKVF